MTLAFVDFETRSMADLKKVGSTRYIHNQTTSVISMVVKCEDRFWVWVPMKMWAMPKPLDIRYFRYLKPQHVDVTDPVVANSITLLNNRDLPPEIESLAHDPDVTWVAHNAFGFDMPLWKALLPCCPHESRWIDTLPLARLGGLPGSLDKLAQAVGMSGKNVSGSKSLTMLSRPRNQRFNRGTPFLWEDMLAYNIDDVELMWRLWPLLEQIIENNVDSFEMEVIEVDREINKLGIKLDIDLLQQMLALWSETKSQAYREAARVSWGVLSDTKLNSVPQVKDFLIDLGIRMESIDKAHVLKLQQMLQLQDMDGSEADDEGVDAGETETLSVPGIEIFEKIDGKRLKTAIDILRLRQQATTSASGKVPTALTLIESDEILRNSIVYHRAGTGRWAGRGVQVHNLPRSVPKGLDLPEIVELASQRDLTYDHLIEIAAETDVLVQDILNAMLRPAFIPRDGKRFIVADFSQIEARCLAWCSNDEEMLEVFRDSRSDPYKLMAARIFGLKRLDQVTKEQRNIGKISVLGCGYGMGHKKFGVMCANAGIDLAAARTSAEEVIKIYREARPAVCSRKEWRPGRFGLWSDFEVAISRAAAGGILASDPFFAGRCRIFNRDEVYINQPRNTLRSMIIELPSKREIIYRNMRTEKMDRWGNGAMQDCPAYTDNMYGMKTLYGGKVTENVCQAISRDILAMSLLKLRGVDGLDVVLHVHDEVIVEVDAEWAEDGLHEMLRLMTEELSWSHGFPIGAAGFVADRYYKSAPKGTEEVEYLNGKYIEI